MSGQKGVRMSRVGNLLFRGVGRVPLVLVAVAVMVLGASREAAAFPSEPPENGWANILIKPPAHWTVHDSLVPEVFGYWSKVYRQGWITPGEVHPNFKIVLGTAHDARTFEDPNKVNHGATDGYALPAGAAGADGFVFQVRAGYGVASGSYPILAGKRVRGGSDGTEFVIDISVALDETVTPAVEVITERVYFLSTYSTEAVRIKIYASEKQDTPAVEMHDLNAPGDFCEVVWRNEPGSTASYTRYNISELAVDHRTYFYLQMLMLLLEKAIPVDRTMPVAEARTAANTPALVISEYSPATGTIVEPDSLFGQFTTLAQKIKGGKPIIRTLLPLNAAGQPKSLAELNDLASSLLTKKGVVPASKQDAPATK